MVTAPVDDIIQVEEEEKNNLAKMADHVSLATNQKTGVPSIQPAIEQQPLDEITQKEAEDYEEEKPEQDSKLGFFLPSLRKSTRTTKALNFLGKKMEWMRKKGGEVALK